MTLKSACSILDIEAPAISALSRADHRDLLAQAKTKFRTLMKLEHPDVNGENGLGDAHTRTVALNEAYKTVRTLTRPHLTITEFFANYARKERQSRASKTPTKRTGRPRRVRQYLVDGTFIREWPSVAAAADAAGIARRRLSACVHSVNGGVRNLAGYNWRLAA